MRTNKKDFFTQTCKNFSEELKRFNILVNPIAPDLDLSSFSEKNINWALNYYI